ncbi:hypothetical protein [Paenibacillus aestuarii]|uniref:Uncharacterized protein n=1 Tax=Paenibacillus aestuarii TaxID=516965 RepID=A0ABW0K7G4_9BACL|nr:hypothetical protein [Paenibacillus aestuarii]
MKELHTLDVSNGKYTNVRIKAAENFILNFVSNGVDHFVPIHLIAGVEIWAGEYDKKWIESIEKSDDKQTDNCESSPLKGFFSPLVGKSQVDFNTLAEQLNDVMNAAVIGLNESLVVLSTRDIVFVVALSSISDVSNIKNN